MRWIPLGLLVAAVVPVVGQGDPPPAFHEDVSTPHWEWVDHHAGGTIKALFLTSFLATREAEELAQRFDIEAEVVPVSANPSAIPSGYDTAFLTNALAGGPDLIFVAYRGAWNTLDAEGIAAVAAAVADGTPLIALSPSGAARDLQREPAADLAAEGEQAIGRNLPAQRLKFPWGHDEGRVKLGVSRHGKGRFINVSMGHGAGGWFNALIPSDDDPPALPVKYETAYAAFARLARWAAGKSSGVACTVRPVGGPPVLGAPFSVRALLDAPARTAFTLEWEIRASYGERLAKGVEEIPRGQSNVELSVPLTHTGELTLLYRVRQDGRVADYGALAVSVPAKLTLAGIQVPDGVEPGERVTVAWAVDGPVDEAGSFLVQVFDADGRLTARTRCPAKARTCTLDPWQSPGGSHCLRMLALTKNGDVLDEQRVRLEVAVDRALDPVRYHVMAWATERGATQEQWRYRRLRQLGITALSPVGRGMIVPRMASAAGLRLAPVNVCVPPNRFKKEFDPAREQQELESYARAMAPLSPLGYSLADEPVNADPWRFRDWAAERIQRQDPGARVGYCGVKMSVGKNVPQIMSSCDFQISYSPHHLYDPNMWLGVEREFQRSFARDDAVHACYTHYAPWKDHEPYSRTVPWLFLFEEDNGISYFATAGGNFSILPGDLRTTHETRWWSEEVRELQKGIATQLIAMRRDTGGIAVLFPTEIPGTLGGLTARAVNTWAAALRELNMPYVFVSREGLLTLDVAATPLLISPAASVMTDAELSAIERYVAGGGTLLASAPFALYEPAPGVAEAPDFWEEQPKAAAAAATMAPAPTQVLAAEEPAVDGGLDELLGDDEPEAEDVVVAPVVERGLDIGALCGVRREPTGGEGGGRQSVFDAIALRGGIPCTVWWTATADGGAVGLKGYTAGQHGLSAAGADVCGTFEETREDAPDFVREAFSSPAAFHYRHGEGHAYYLNFAPTAEAARELAVRFREQTGAAAPAAEVTVAGVPAPATYLFPLVGGGVQALGIIQDYARVGPAFVNTDKQTALYYHHGPYRWEAHEARLRLREAAHVYDMRGKEYKGLTDDVEFSLRPGEPQLFALLPYAVRGLDVEAPDAVGAGESIAVHARVLTDSEAAGDHVVHVRVLQREEPHALGYSGDFMLRGGEGSFHVPTALSDAGGDWTVEVCDALSGASVGRMLRIETAEDTGPPIAGRDVEVSRTALDWGQGEWQPYVDPESENLTNVLVTVGRIARKRINYGQFSGKWCLQAKTLLRLTGRQAEYGLTYFACNDWKDAGWKDERRVRAYSMSGLGVNGPAPHLWYYNGYIDIYYDDQRVTSYRIADVRAVDAGEDGRVDVTWDSPAGSAVLSFGVTLDGDALLQRLLVRPAVPVETVRLEFRSYIGDFGNLTARYVKTVNGKYKGGTRDRDPKQEPWAFYADDIQDRAFGKGKGAGGIVVLPEDWDRVLYGLAGALESRVDLQPGETKALHWALWLYDDLSNEDAFKALKQSVGPTTSALQEFFGESAGRE